MRARASVCLLKAEIASVLQDASTRFSSSREPTRWPAEPTRRTHQFAISTCSTRRAWETRRNALKFTGLENMMKLLWAHALVGTASALLPVIVPMGDNTNDTLLTWR